MRISRLLFVGIVLALVSACSLPRGAALQREILAGSDDEFPEVAVHAVTRDFLPVIAGWPKIDDGIADGWPSKGGHHHAADIAIKPFDMIDLVVWDSEANSLLTNEAEKVVDIPELRVTESGQIFVPYIGYLRVADRTPDSARRLIEREMAAIVPSAQVQLRLQPGSRGSVSLVGGAGSPGSYPLPEANFTLLDLIGMGGGPSGMRNPQVRLIRGDRTYATSYASLLDSPSHNTVLRGGDKVALVEDDRYFRALGAAGEEDLIHFERESITALDALGMMGGVQDRRADPKGILILREYPPRAVRLDGTGPDNTRVIFTIDLTSADGLFSAGKFDVLPGDTVLATESPVTLAETAVALFGTFYGLTNRLAN